MATGVSTTFRACHKNNPKHTLAHTHTGIHDMPDFCKCERGVCGVCVWWGKHINEIMTYLNGTQQATGWLSLLLLCRLRHDWATSGSGSVSQVP